MISVELRAYPILGTVEFLWLVFKTKMRPTISSNKSDGPIIVDSCDKIEWKNYHIYRLGNKILTIGSNERYCELKDRGCAIGFRVYNPKYHKVLKMDFSFLKIIKNKKQNNA